jgi:CDGSH iron-sulfur domain-containing protein 3
MPISDSTQKTPYKFHVEKGKTYSWCSCGFSQKEPLCDGAHKIMAMDLKSVKYFADEDKIVSFCGCKKTKTPPFCDSSHKEC